MPVPEQITCMECGGTAHLLTPLDPEEPPEPGDVLAYRCSDCMERWDVVYEEDDPGTDETDGGV